MPKSKPPKRMSRYEHDVQAVKNSAAIQGKIVHVITESEAVHIIIANQAAGEIIFEYLGNDRYRKRLPSQIYAEHGIGDEYQIVVK